MVKVGAEDEGCPIPAVHARLNEAHIHWHEALGAYHEPHAFRAFLNACIQALRNVTFVLQKNKRSIPAFDSWYRAWQERLKSDPVLRWLVHARNKVVKQGDLETKSIARLSIVDRYLQLPVLVLDVDPFAPLAELGRLAGSFDLPEHTREHGSVRIERRWHSSDLEERELLDALGHCYGVLSSLVADAHGQAGFSRELAEACTGGINVTAAHRGAERLGGRPPCMVATEAHRTIWIRLKSGEEFSLASFEVSIDDFDKEALQARYGTLERRGAVDPKDLKQLAEGLYRIGERILERDGYHDSIAFLVLPDSSLFSIALVTRDQAEKYVVFDDLAAHVRRTSAEALVFIGESWLAPFDPEHPGRPARESPDRVEVLGIDAIAKTGDRISWCKVFTREGGQIVLGERREFRSGGTGYLEPVLRVWREEAQG